MSELSQSASQTHLQIKEKASALEQLYVDAKIELPTTANLSRLLVEAKKLSELPHTDTSQVFRMLRLDRIADAILSF